MLLDDHLAGGKYSAADIVAKAQAVLLEPELLRAVFDVGYSPPNTPPPVQQCFYVVVQTARWESEVPPDQAVWPSNSPVLGIFFFCCGVIFEVSGPPGTPRGPSFLRAISSSVSSSTSRVSRGISRLPHKAVDLARTK